MSIAQQQNRPLETQPSPRAESRELGRRSWLRSAIGLHEVRWSFLSLLLFLAALGASTFGSPAIVAGALLAGCYLAGGWEPTLDGLRALRERSLDVDLLMIVAAIGAAAIGQGFDGGLLIVIFATSGALEAVATNRTEESVRSLLKLAPEQASRVGQDETLEVVNTADLNVGDVILIRPGERIGADGTVAFGASDVDQASITGEPLPVSKSVGADVFAGTLNGSGMLHVRVDRVAADSVVARIVALVAEASATNAKTQLFIEKVEQRYSVGVVAATLLLFTIPLVAGANLTSTLLRAMTFMIVASPCAVVLATMPPLLSAIANAGRHGVLVKSASVMEQLGRTDLVAFDKTGTLTDGTPDLTEALSLDESRFSVGQVLSWAAAVERSSEHPLGRAIVAAAADRQLDPPHVTEFESVPGRGVEATIDDQRVAVGNGLAPVERDEHGGASATARRLQALGLTVVLVSVDGVVVGVLALADRLRPTAPATVAALRELTGRNPVLLTGDNSDAAKAVAGQLGITDLRAGLLPNEKVDEVNKLQVDGTRVALVGDGVNDAPALAAAHLGIAMGRNGSDLTLDTADVILVRDDLTTIPAVIELSTRARRIIVQNLTFAGLVICALVLVDLIGHLPLPLGVAGHEGSTLVVGLNGLRLLRGGAWANRSRTVDDTPSR